jgi:hypothetical protein
VPLAIGLNFNFFGLYGSLSPELYWGGEQAAWWSPMAVAVIVGIIFATVLTLIVVPTMYSLVDDVSDWFQRHFTSPDAGAPALASETGSRAPEPGTGSDARRPKVGADPRQPQGGSATPGPRPRPKEGAPESEPATVGRFGHGPATQ